MIPPAAKAIPPDTHVRHGREDHAATFLADVAGDAAPVDEALAVRARFVEHAERASLQIYRVEAARV